MGGTASVIAAPEDKEIYRMMAAVGKLTAASVAGFLTYMNVPLNFAVSERIGGGSS